MANVIYPKYREALLDGAANVGLNDAAAVKVVLLDLADYTYDAAHDFLSDIPAAARVGTPQALANRTVTGGVFDADDPTIPDVTGDQLEALAIFIDTGVEATSRLVAYFDTGLGGVPLTPNGSGVVVQFAAGGIFAL